MLKNIGGLLAIIVLFFGWLKAHDHYIKANTLAEARRDSLLLASKITIDYVEEITKYQDSLKEKGNALQKAQDSLSKLQKGLAKIQDSNEVDLSKWKDSLLAIVHCEAVDTLINKYDALVLTLKERISVADSQLTVAQAQTVTADSLYLEEHIRFLKIQKLNDDLVADLKKPIGSSLGNKIINYILPSATAGALITLIITNGK